MYVYYDLSDWLTDWPTDPFDWPIDRLIDVIPIYTGHYSMFTLHFFSFKSVISLFQVYLI